MLSHFAQDWHSLLQALQVIDGQGFVLYLCKGYSRDNLREQASSEVTYSHLIRGNQTFTSTYRVSLRSILQVATPAYCIRVLHTACALNARLYTGAAGLAT